MSSANAGRGGGCAEQARTQLPADVRERFDDGAAYERFMGPWSRAAGRVFLEWLAASPNALWLDVGCGTGIFTGLIADMARPAGLHAIDPEPVQIEHARREHSRTAVSFQVADACALPFPDGMFSAVASALVLNFIPDQRRALLEMRRVAKGGALIAGYVWDFAENGSPSWPLRRGLQALGLRVPAIAGASDSTVTALQSSFARAGLESIATRSIEVVVPFRNFETFWEAQTRSYGPLARMVASMSACVHTRLIDAVRASFPRSPGDRIEYVARANAIKARAPE